MIPNVLYAAFSMVSIWVFHWPLQENVTPRCLWFSTKFIIVLLKFKEGRKSTGLRENNIATVLIGLNSTSHF